MGTSSEDKEATYKGLIMDELSPKEESERWVSYKQHNQDLKEAEKRGDKESARRILEKIQEQKAHADAGGAQKGEV